MDVFAATSDARCPISAHLTSLASPTGAIDVLSTFDAATVHTLPRALVAVPRGLTRVGSFAPRRVVEPPVRPLGGPIRSARLAPSARHRARGGAMRPVASVVTKPLKCSRFVTSRYR